MTYTTITGQKDFLESLRGKSATYMIALSNTKTHDIQGITQAGIPGKIYLTPTLDAEFLCTGEVRTLEDVAETPKGVPTPALITRGVHVKKPFSNIELLNLGMIKKPNVKHFSLYDFDLECSGAINEGANIDAMSLFEKGLNFGKEYELKNDYIILAECVPSGTTTAYAVAKGLGYNVDNLFSSSFKNSPLDIKNQVVIEALNNIDDSMDIFSKLGMISDNMIIFNAGFLLGLASKQAKVILAGGTQMASVLLVVNSIVQQMGGVYDSSNIALCTTKWVNEDTQSDLKKILQMLDFDINAYACDFDFKSSSHPALKLYDEGEAKEGVGAGAALCYASINGVSKEEIIKQIEEFLG